MKKLFLAIAIPLILAGCTTAGPTANVQPAVVTASGAAVPVSALEAKLARYCPNVVDTATLLTFAASFQHNVKVSDGVALAAKIVRAVCAEFS